MANEERTRKDRREEQTLLGKPTIFWVDVEKLEQVAVI